MIEVLLAVMKEEEYRNLLLLLLLRARLLQHRFNIPVSLIKRRRSLIEAVLISFGLANSFPKMFGRVLEQAVDKIADNIFESTQCTIHFNKAF